MQTFFLFTLYRFSWHLVNPTKRKFTIFSYFNFLQSKLYSFTWHNDKAVRGSVIFIHSLFLFKMLNSYNKSLKHDMLVFVPTYCSFRVYVCAPFFAHGLNLHLLFFSIVCSFFPYVLIVLTNYGFSRQLIKKNISLIMCFFVELPSHSLA